MLGFFFGLFFFAWCFLAFQLLLCQDASGLHPITLMTIVVFFFRDHQWALFALVSVHTLVYTKSPLFELFMLLYSWDEMETETMRKVLKEKATFTNSLFYPGKYFCFSLFVSVPFICFSVHLFISQQTNIHYFGQIVCFFCLLFWGGFIHVRSSGRKLSNCKIPFCLQFGISAVCQFASNLLHMVGMPTIHTEISMTSK